MATPERTLDSTVLHVGKAAAAERVVAGECMLVRRLRPRSTAEEVVANRDRQQCEWQDAREWPKRYVAWGIPPAAAKRVRVPAWLRHEVVVEWMKVAAKMHGKRAQQVIMLATLNSHHTALDRIA